MEVIEFTPTPADFAYTLGGASPVRRVRPGDVLRLWCEDAFGGALRSTDDRSSEKVDFTHVNPQTGPFYVEGAMPGDTLALHLVSITPARDWGVSAAIPYFGGLTSTELTATLQEPLPDATWIYAVDSTRGTVEFAARGSDFTRELPMAPMLGTVGVAPAGGEVRSSLVPERFGGNMDTPLLRAGATCYLPVNVPGALFSVGDGHYRQGEGEACGTAVEGAVWTTLIVDLVKGDAAAWPIVEDDEGIATIGSSRPLEDAWRIAHSELVAVVSRVCGLDRMDSYQLTSQISEAPIANVVDVNYSAIARVPKALLGASPLFDDLHRSLADRAMRI